MRGWALFWVVNYRYAGPAGLKMVAAQRTSQAKGWREFQPSQWDLDGFYPWPPF